MPRFFEPISIIELENKIKEVAPNLFDSSYEYDDIFNLMDYLGDDIKVQFDLENFDLGDQDGSDPLVGFQTNSSGLTYLGIFAGGDWEFPVYFIVYWDGKKLRGYVPTDGNPWNTKTKTAYGNDDSDDENIMKRYKLSLDKDSLSFDPKLISQDIEKRITLKTK